MKNTFGLTIIISTLIFLSFGCTEKTSKPLKKNIESKAITTLDKGFYKAIYTPNSENIITTAQDDKGLKLFNVKNNSSKILNDLNGAGTNPLFSRDGENIVIQSYEFKNRRRQTSLFVQNIETSELIPIVENKRNIKLIEIVDDYVIFLEGEEVKFFDINNNNITENIPISSFAFVDNNLNLVVYDNGSKEIINPQGEGNYIWVSTSPDKNKILYNKAGKGTYICDLKGETLVDLGRLHAANWSKDGKWVIGMDDYDDGHMLTKSDIIMISSDGKNKQNLTQNSDRISLYPNISHDNKNVIYHNEEGRVFVMKLKE